jgi:hypothetical protein
MTHQEMFCFPAGKWHSRAETPGVGTIHPAGTGRPDAGRVMPYWPPMARYQMSGSASMRVKLPLLHAPVMAKPGGMNVPARSLSGLADGLPSGR